MNWSIERRKSGWMLYTWEWNLHKTTPRIVYAYGLRKIMAIYTAFAFGAKMVWHVLPDGQTDMFFPPKDPSVQ
jgi:hypothetical protein